MEISTTQNRYKSAHEKWMTKTWNVGCKDMKMTMGHKNALMEIVLSNTPSIHVSDMNSIWKVKTFWYRHICMLRYITTSFLKLIPSFHFIHVIAWSLFSLILLLSYSFMFGFYPTFWHLEHFRLLSVFIISCLPMIDKSPSTSPS